MTPARIVAGLLAAFCLVACGGGDDGTSTGPDATDPSTGTADTASGSGDSPSFEYDPAGMRSLGCTTSSGDVDESLTAGDADCVTSLWTTSQLDEAIEAKDCATITAVRDYASTHGEIEHDGPIATYAGDAAEQNGCS